MTDDLFQMPQSTGPGEGQLTPVVVELYCRVHGKVQGVMFRTFVAKQAERLRLKGYVKNMPDGTVEVLAQGGERDLTRFMQLLHHGSSTARVTEVEEEWRKPKDTFTSFEVVE